MHIYAGSPVKDITFGEASTITLNNYYDLLKAQVGSLQAGEFLQLKLVADVIDVSLDKKASEGGYVWFSYHNLLERSDLAIHPGPISGEVQVGLERLSAVYGRFLRRLRQFVTVKELSPQEQVQVADIDKAIDALKEEADDLYIRDRTRWERVAPAMGFSVGDSSAYIQWSTMSGSIRLIEEKHNQIRKLTFDKKTILDRQYPNKDDKDIIDAEFEFDNPLVRLRYPVWPDYTYPEGDQFSPPYLARLGLGSNALFVDRYVAKFGQTLTTIKTVGNGTLVGEFDKSTSESSSITTDWSASGGGRYAFIRANASVSEHKQIQEEFKKATNIKLGAASATRIGLDFPSWFRPTLFKHRHVLANPSDFVEFFGLSGSLLYYPTALIVVRGFSAEFLSTQDWKYDYERRFSASGGGGFSAFGISFGSKASYSSHVTEHKVEKSKTSLKFSDDAGTIRFVGYAVKKNDMLLEPVSKALDSLGLV